MRPNINKWPSRFAATTMLLIITMTIKVAAQSPADSIDLYLKQKMKELRIPGMQIAVVRHGKIIKLTSYGFANLEDSLPVTNHTAFAIHSITKAFTGVAAMQLVEAGRLYLNAPVSRYLDSLPQAWQPITIRQLLTHMSGIPDIINQTAQMIDNDDSIAYKKVQSMPMLFSPGEKFKYTMTNYVLIGKVIDKLTAEPFTRFMKERQFDVVGMFSTSFSDSRDVIPHLSESYWYMRNVHNRRVPTKKPQIYFRDWPQLIRAAAGINTTAEELAKWSIVVQEGKLVTSKSLKVLWTPGTLNNGTHQSFSTIVDGYGLGWPVTLRREHPAYGPTGGSCTALFIYPEDDLSIILLTNLSFSNPEAYIDQVAAFYIPDMHDYNGFGFGEGTINLNKALRKQGFNHAAEVVNKLKGKDEKIQFEENALNGWAYALMAHKEAKNAIAIFRLNIDLYPQSWNAYDSLAEAYESVDDREQAIKNYKRSIELNPKNNHATGRLKYLHVDIK